MRTMNTNAFAPSPPSCSAAGCASVGRLAGRRRRGATIGCAPQGRGGRCGFVAHFLCATEPSTGATHAMAVATGPAPVQALEGADAASAGAGTGEGAASAGAGAGEGVAGEPADEAALSAPPHETGWSCDAEAGGSSDCGGGGGASGRACDAAAPQRAVALPAEPVFVSPAGGCGWAPALMGPFLVGAPGWPVGRSWTRPIIR